MIALRVFFATELLLILLGLWAHHSHGLLHGNPWMGTLVAGSGLGVLFLATWIQGIRKVLKDSFTPLLVFMSVLILLVLKHEYFGLDLFGQSGRSEESTWVQFILLFVPLVFVAWQSPKRMVILFILASSVADYLFGWWLQESYSVLAAESLRAILWRAVAFLIAGLMLSYLLKHLRTANRALQIQAITIGQLSESRERNRLARELHDTLAHSLSALAVQLEAVDAIWNADSIHAHELMRDALLTARKGLMESRRAIQNLRASSLETLGLSGALREASLDAVQRLGAQIQMSIPMDFPELPEDVAQCFFRIGQEALENAVQHSRAKEMVVSLESFKGGVRLAISDNGCGFTIQQKDSEGHFGLRGMRERAELIQAELHIQSNAGQGSSVSLMWRNH